MSAAFATAASFPDDADDDYYLIAVIDGSDVYDEAHEHNNALVFQGGAFVVDTGSTRTLHVHGTEDADDLLPRIIDATDDPPAFVAAPNEWKNNPDASYTYDDRRLLAYGNSGSKAATWTFDDLLPRMYQVALWIAGKSPTDAARAWRSVPAKEFGQFRALAHLGA